MPRKPRALRTMSVALALGVSTASAQTLYVDNDATGPHDGASWCNAFTELYEALDAASSGAVVRVANGTYFPDTTGLANPQDATFQLVNGVTIEGGYAGCGAPDPNARDIPTHVTRLSGDLFGDDDPNGPASPRTSNCCTVSSGPGCDDFACEFRVCQTRPECCTGVWDYRCRGIAKNICCTTCGTNLTLCDNVFHVVTASGTNAATVLDGLTILGGNAVGGDPADQNGGGIYNEAGSPTIQDCTISWNTAGQNGGGFYNAAGSEPTVIRTVFENNTARGWPGVGGVQTGGGGMASFDSNPRVVDSTFRANEAVIWDDGICAGGGMLNYRSGAIVQNCTFENNYGEVAGGGAANVRLGDMTFSGCTFIGNSAGSWIGAGGLFASGLSQLGDNTLLITGCVFRENSSGWLAGGALVDGRDALEIITDCAFIQNSANASGGGLLGGDLISNCTFVQNSSASNGGGLSTQGAVFNTSFIENSADRSGGGAFVSGDVTITNSLFVRNTAGQNGGGLGGEFPNTNFTHTISNSTFYANSAGQDGGGIHLTCRSTTSPSLLSITNTILWGNTDSGGNNTGESAQLSVDSCIDMDMNYTSVQGLTGTLGGIHNFGDDPLFVDAAMDDLRLSSTSPYIDAGDNSAVPPDIADLDGDGDMAEPTPLDLDGNPRFVDDSGTPDTGDPGTLARPLVDFGAYEFTLCGNGDIDPGEQCDDGNLNDGDACSSACVIVPSPLEVGGDPFDPQGSIGPELNRVGAFKMPGSAAGQEVTIRVTLVHPYIDSNADPANGCPVRGAELPDLGQFENQVRYLGPPSAFDDNDTVSTPQFIAAKLQCTPYYRDWNPDALTADFGAGVDTDTIYYYGKEVFPCSGYEAQQASQACVESGHEGCYSTSLEIRTALWGDVWPPFGNPGQPNFTDIGKIVEAFKRIPFVSGNPPDGAPRKVRAMLRGNSAPLDSTINFTDIGNVVNAFKTIAYAEDGPSACP